MRLSPPLLIRIPLTTILCPLWPSGLKGLVPSSRYCCVPSGFSPAAFTASGVVKDVVAGAGSVAFLRTQLDPVCERHPTASTIGGASGGGGGGSCEYATSTAADTRRQIMLVDRFMEDILMP